ncbi:guanylate kinase [Patescibacteria group bacterium]|nr:guanylate kinase [Patescibacteria group bacterium]
MKGKLFLILGSSGSGKGTVLNGLLTRHSDWVFPLSCTTRDKRPNEKDGEIYNFISKEEFRERIERGEFLEHAVVHQDNYYGTLKGPILDALEEGKVVIREVDVQGLRSIREIIPEDQLVSVFLTVESWDELKGRILRRAEMSDEELEKRYQSFLAEKEWEKECDHVLMTETGKTEEMIGVVDEIILNEIKK